MTVLLSSVDASESARQISAVTGAEWGCLVESMLTHDPERTWNTRIKGVFLSAIQSVEREALNNHTFARAVVNAASLALETPVPTSHGTPSLMFTVVVARQGEWLISNLGANLIFHFTKHGVRLACMPHSALDQLGSNQGDAAEWRRLGGTYLPTALATAHAEWSDKLRTLRIRPDTGDWLLVAPHSLAGHDVLARQKPPRALPDIQELVELLARPYANYTRTWLAATTQASN